MYSLWVRLLINCYSLVAHQCVIIISSVLLRSTLSMVFNGPTFIHVSQVHSIFDVLPLSCLKRRPVTVRYMRCRWRTSPHITNGHRSNNWWEMTIWRSLAGSIVFSSALCEAWVVEFFFCTSMILESFNFFESWCFQWYCQISPPSMIWNCVGMVRQLASTLVKPRALGVELNKLEGR